MSELIKTCKLVNMPVRCIGEACEYCPDLDLSKVERVVYVNGKAHNYLQCAKLSSCLRIMEFLRKNSNSDNEKDGV